MLSQDTIFWLGTTSVSISVMRRLAQYFGYTAQGERFELAKLVNPPFGFWLTIVLGSINGFCFLAAYSYANLGYLWLILGCLYLLIVICAIALHPIFGASLSPDILKKGSFLNFRLEQEITGSIEPPGIRNVAEQLVLLSLWLISWSWQAG